MKWALVEPLRGELELAARRRARRLRSSANMDRRSAATRLVWHSQLPQWLIERRRSAAAGAQRSDGCPHCSREAGRYRGRDLRLGRRQRSRSTTPAIWRGGVLLSTRWAPIMSPSRCAPRAPPTLRRSSTSTNTTSNTPARNSTRSDQLVALAPSGPARRSTASACRAISSPARPLALSIRLFAAPPGSRRSTSTSRSPNSIRASNFPATAPPRSPPPGRR